MLEVILDTETTGLSTAENHKIVEIGCIELNNQIPTNNIFHKYIMIAKPLTEYIKIIFSWLLKFTHMNIL